MGIKVIKIAKEGGRHAANVNAQRHFSSQSSIISKNKGNIRARISSKFSYYLSMLLKIGKLDLLLQY